MTKIVFGTQSQKSERKRCALHNNDDRCQDANDNDIKKITIIIIKLSS